MADIFDFGFTAVDEDELDAVKNVKSEASSSDDKLNALYNAVIPLLNNLKKNPEKDYILWPDRLNKVEQFEDHLTKIYKG
jgi:hypothetical protein|tara:strand:- start:49601 stop:49840 length:240 start_codon:yes stop_codon:yes gene_type:complete